MEVIAQGSESISNNCQKLNDLLLERHNLQHSLGHTRARIDVRIYQQRTRDRKRVQTVFPRLNAIWYHASFKQAELAIANFFMINWILALYAYQEDMRLAYIVRFEHHQVISRQHTTSHLP